MPLVVLVLVALAPALAAFSTLFTHRLSPLQVKSKHDCQHDYDDECEQHHAAIVTIQRYSPSIRTREPIREQRKRQCCTICCRTPPPSRPPEHGRNQNCTTVRLRRAHAIVQSAPASSDPVNGIWHSPVRAMFGKCPRLFRKDADLNLNNARA